MTVLLVNILHVAWQLCLDLVLLDVRSGVVWYPILIMKTLIDGFQRRLLVSNSSMIYIKKLRVGGKCLVRLQRVTRAETRLGTAAIAGAVVWLWNWAGLRLRNCAAYVVIL